jgi:cellulose biosynthesis protein BcsQ
VSVIYDTFRKIERNKMDQERTELNRVRTNAGDDPRAVLANRVRKKRPFKVLTVTSNKGGVGKTTISTNLAVYFRALREDLPILILGMDDQSQLDRMFALDDAEPEHTVATGLRAGTFKNIIRLGQYGVHYVPSAMNASELKQEISNPMTLLETLERTDFHGLVIVDTKSDLEILTRNAVAASDLLLVPVKNDTSLQEAKKVFGMLGEWGWPQERARIVLSMIDRRIKYRQAGDEMDVLGLLLQEIRKLGYPLLESFISGSPKVESLSTNPAGRVNSVLQGAAGSIVHKQLHHVASEVLALLDEVGNAAAVLDAPNEVSPPTDEEVEPEFEDGQLTVRVQPAPVPIARIELESVAAPAVAPAPAPAPAQAQAPAAARRVEFIRPAAQAPTTPNIADMIRGTSPSRSREHLQAVPEPAPAPIPEATLEAGPEGDPTPEESRDAFREARVLIDRWKRQSSAKNPFSARSIWRRNRTFQIEKDKTGTR